MQKTRSCLKNNSAMTLVEILVSLVILGLVLMAIFPLLTQSLQMTSLANRITTQLFADQEDIEIVAATNGGVLFANGDFLTDKQFKVLLGDEAHRITRTMVGMTIKKSKLVRFIASIAHIKAAYVYEGYNANEAEIPITGNRTSFIDTTRTVLLVTDCNGNDVTSYCGYAVSNKTKAKLTLPTGSSRFTNLHSPYTITMTTGNEQVSTLLPVHLPRAIAVDTNGDLRISSNAKDWIAKDTSSIIKHAINKIASSTAASEYEAMFVAVGDSGSIYIWPSGEQVQRINHGLTTNNLNHIISSSDGFLAVGDGGVILTSSDGINWNMQISNTTENLQSISYQANSERFISVGNGGIILTSPNGTKWNPQPTYPLLVENGINNHKAVKFSGEGDYLYASSAPVTGVTKRTVLMVAKPSKHTANLLAWGSPLDTIEGGRFSFLIDNDGKLRVEQGSGISYSSSSLLPNLTGQTSLFICLSNPSNVTSYNLYMNEGSPDPSNVSATNTISDFKAQLGSNPLTRYNDPLNFQGFIAEVLVFDTAVRTTRDDLDPPDVNKHYASDLDLLRKYLSYKYDLGLSSLDGTDMANLIDPISGNPLSTINLDDFPAAVSQDNLVLWLDASEINLNDGQQVLEWLEPFNRPNRASGAALLSVASSTELVVSGGYHRNLLNSADTSSWNQTHQLGTKKTTEYRLDNMIYADTNFVALLNDGLSSFSEINPEARQNGYIAYSTDGVIWTLKDLSSTSNDLMNDMYYSVSSGTILVAGNNGSIFTSSDNGETWVEVDLGTFHNNLLSGCIR